MNYRFINTEDELYHHGIKGQKWGRRRFQNDDGSYTSAGRSRYGIGDGKKALLTGGLAGYAKYRKDTEGIRTKAKADFQAAKKQHQEAISEAASKKVRNFGLGKKGSKDRAEKRAAYEKANLDYMHKKAEYKKNTKGDKAEMKVYQKEFRKYGLPDGNNTAAKAYRSLASKKGKAYADKVVTKERHRQYREIAGQAVVGVGQLALSAYLLKRFESQ